MPYQEELSLRIGNNIRRLRKRQNLTQAELAEKVDLSEKSVQRIEKGKQHSDLRRLETIANALDSDVKILFEEQPKSDLRECRQQYSSAIKTCNEKEKRFVYTIASTLIEKLKELESRD